MRCGWSPNYFLWVNSTSNYIYVCVHVWADYLYLLDLVVSVFWSIPHSSGWPKTKTLIYWWSRGLFDNKGNLSGTWSTKPNGFVQSLSLSLSLNLNFWASQRPVGWVTDVTSIHVEQWNFFTYVSIIWKVMYFDSFIDYNLLLPECFGLLITALEEHRGFGAIAWLLGPFRAKSGKRFKCSSWSLGEFAKDLVWQYLFSARLGR